MGKSVRGARYRLATESQWSEARQRGVPGPLMEGGGARGKRTGRQAWRLLRAPSHAGCRPRVAEPAVPRAQSRLRPHRGEGARARMAQQPRGAGLVKNEIRGQLSKRLSLLGRTKPSPLFADTRAPLSQRLRLQGAACWLGGHEYFLKNVYACNPVTPGTLPKIHVLFKTQEGTQVK